MDFLGNIALLLDGVKAPTGLWASLINWLEGGIGNYAVVLILLTLMIKLVLLPFDFLNKYLSKKNMRQQAIIQPELEKLNKRYGNNKQLLNQKTMELYKKNNVSMYGTCAGMLVYMGLTLTVFITLFSTLRGMSAYKIKQEYETLKTTYVATIQQQEGDVSEDVIFSEENGISEVTLTLANEAVVQKYGEIKSGFLWIKNIWRPDSTAKVTLSYKNFLKETKLSAEDISETQYNVVMNPIATSDKYSGANGYFILAILSCLATLGTTLITNALRKFRAKRKGVPYIKGADGNIVTIVIMALIMGLFTLLYTSAFGIYIVTGNLFTLITSPFVSLLVDIIDEKKAKKQAQTKKVSYSR